MKPRTPEPVETQVIRWFRDADLTHPAVRLLFEIAVERRLARTVGPPRGR